MTGSVRSAVALRGATAADLPAVIDLEVSGFPAREQWSPASWRAELEAADRIVLLATDPDDRSAVLGVITYQVGPDTADLMRVVVDPAARGRRVGRALVQAGLMHVRSRGVSRVLLEVRHDNATAIALYAGCGFTTVATRPGYYGPGADASVMAADIETDLPPFAHPRPKVTGHD